MIYPWQWADQARYDLETADAMLKAGRYLYVLFCCQQAVEKVAECSHCPKDGRIPPRVHNLVRLAEVAEIASDSERIRFFGELSGYYIQSRYPEEIRRRVQRLRRSLPARF